MRPDTWKRKSAIWIAALASVAILAGCSRPQEGPAGQAQPAAEAHETVAPPAMSPKVVADAPDPGEDVDAAGIEAAEDAPKERPPATPVVAAVAATHQAATPVSDTPRRDRGWWDRLPLAPMGEPPSRTALASAPGYAPPEDPEAEAVRTGRRKVGPIDRIFDGGEPSPEDLANAILDALRHDDRKGLERLLVTEEEFATILWPEFPQSRPITNLEAGDAYDMLARTSFAGISSGLSGFAGQEILLDSLQVRTGRAPYTNFLILRDVQIVGRTIEGDPRMLDFAEDFVCRDGMWKVYTYKD